MITILQDFYTEAEKWIPTFDAFVSKHELEGKTLADHICLKCNSSESFEKYRKLFEHESDYMYQSIISGRRISYIKMKQGIATSLGTIYFLELSDQKPDQSQKETFDHIEVYPATITYDEMVQLFHDAGETVIEANRPHHKTHDIFLENNFIFRCTKEPLIEKVKQEEMK